MSDRELIEAARSCEECTCWLEVCEAECCKIFTFNLTLRSDVRFGPDEVRLHTAITPDLKRYYELHGATVEGDWVTVPRSACRTTLDKLEVFMTCRELRDDGLCGLHKRGKPSACADLDLRTASSGDWALTPRCLYGYKLAAAESGEGESRQDVG